MRATNFVFLAALVLDVASTTAFTGVPSTSLRLGEGQATTPLLSYVSLYPRVDLSYQAVYGPQFVLAASMLAPATPLLLHDDTSCGMEDEAVETAKLQGTSPVRPLVDNKEMVIKPAYISAYSQGPAKLLSWGSEEMNSFYLNNIHSKVHHHRRFLSKGQRAFGLSDASAYLTKTGAGLTGSVAMSWAVAFPEETCKLISMIAASPHWTFLLLLLIFAFMLSTVLNMEHTAPAEKKGQVYLIETLESGEGAGEESRRLFEEEGLMDTVFAVLLGAEDEGAKAVPPFFKKMVSRQMTKIEEWTWKAIKGRYAVVLKPLPARVDTAPSTPTSSFAGEDERDRSESVLPRAAPSPSINIDAAVAVMAAPKPKKVGKMATFRAGWRRIFRIRKKTSFPRVTVASLSVVA